MNFRCKINCTVRLSSNKPGLVLVSTGILKVGIAIRNGEFFKNPKLLKINDKNNFALAA